MADGFGYHIPKGYLYAAIGFSILIESFNQVSWRNLARKEAQLPLRERTANTILGLMGGRQSVDDAAEILVQESTTEAYGEEERFMISGVLTLGQRSTRMIMTPRMKISWINCESGAADVRSQLLETPHSLFPVCRGVLDEVVGVVRVKDLLIALDEGVDLAAFAAQHPPIVVLDTTDVIKLLGVLREAKGSLVLVVDEYGSVEGLVTPLDILEAIAGEFPDADETPEIVRDGDAWLVKGTADLHLLAQSLGNIAFGNTDDYVTMSGLLLAQYEKIPAVGESLQFGDFRFEVMAISDRRVELVRVTRALFELAQA
jgi:CBS domain containing-hemolysin-like protein